MKMEKTEFGNKTDFIGPYNYNNVFVLKYKKKKKLFKKK